MIEVIGDESLLPDALFQADTLPFQASWDEWGRAYRQGARGATLTPESKTPDLLIMTAYSRASAVAALQAVAYIGITPLIASYAQCAAILDRIGAVPGIKGIMLIFPECLAGLQEFGERVLPLMRTAKLAPPRV